MNHTHFAVVGWLRFMVQSSHHPGFPFGIHFPLSGVIDQNGIEEPPGDLESSQGFASCEMRQPGTTAGTCLPAEARQPFGRGGGDRRVEAGCFLPGLVEATGEPNRQDGRLPACEASLVLRADRQLNLQDQTVGFLPKPFFGGRRSVINVHFREATLEGSMSIEPHRKKKNQLLRTLASVALRAALSARVGQDDSSAGPVRQLAGRGALCSGKCAWSKGAGVHQ